MGGSGRFPGNSRVFLWFFINFCRNFSPQDSRLRRGKTGKNLNGLETVGELSNPLSGKRCSRIAMLDFSSGINRGLRFIWGENLSFHRPGREIGR